MGMESAETVQIYRFAGAGAKATLSIIVEIVQVSEGWWHQLGEQQG